MKNETQNTVVPEASPQPHLMVYCLWVLSALLVVGIIILMTLIVERVAKTEPTSVDGNTIKTVLEIIPPGIPKPMIPDNYVETTGDLSQDLHTIGYEPVVSYARAGAIPEAHKQQILERVIQPAIDYYNEDAVHVVAFRVEAFASGNVGDDPYSVEMTFLPGEGYSGELIHVTDGEIDWWGPTCLEACEFSQSFIEKYPEIISLYQ